MLNCPLRSYSWASERRHLSTFTYHTVILSGFKLMPLSGAHFLSDRPVLLGSGHWKDVKKYAASSELVFPWLLCPCVNKSAVPSLLPSYLSGKPSACWEISDYRTSSANALVSPVTCNSYHLTVWQNPIALFPALW